jgi:hypothetical protein
MPLEIAELDAPAPIRDALLEVSKAGIFMYQLLGGALPYDEIAHLNFIYRK